MKKILSLALAMLFLLLCCACSATEGNATEETSEPASDETVSDEVSHEPFVESEMVAKINSFLSKDVDKTLMAKNIFSKRSYTFSVEPNDGYQDTRLTKLTDGIVVDVFDKQNWVGFTTGNPVEITFDLGDKEHALSVVEVGSLNQTSYAIYLPYDVRLAVSDDGKEYVELGNIMTPSDWKDSSRYVYRFVLPKATDARFVKIIVDRRTSGFFFVDEIIGYEYAEDGNVDINSGEQASSDEGTLNFYSYTLNHDVTVPVSDTDADFNKEQNLALLDGVDVQIKHFDPMTEDVTARNSPIEEAYKLHDGEKAKSPVYSDKAWFRMARGYGRHIDVDLGNIMAVSGLNAEFLNQVGVGVGTPPAINVSISLDGQEWFTVYGDTTDLRYGDKTNVCNYAAKVKFNKTYRARYVRLTFTTVPHNSTSSMVYLSEIEVIGKKNTENASTPEEDMTQPMGHYPDADAMGVKAIMLSALENINSTNSTKPLNSQMARTYYAKLDADGKATDVFYDCFCFSPANAFAKTGDKKKDGLAFIDEVYTEGYNLSALNLAVGEVNRELGIDQTPTYFISLYCLGSAGQTEEEIFNLLREQADYALQKDAACGYSNIRLAGFYYHDECLFENNEDITVAALVRFNAYLHEKGLISLWCPYYNAYGIWRWREAGFDIACLQPNYLFHATESTRLATCAATAKLYGMCVEMEHEDVSSKAVCERYQAYIKEGIRSGYMHSIQMYYEGSVGGAICSAYGNSLPYAAAVYEDTYAYVKGTLDETYGASSSVDFGAIPEKLELTVQNGKLIDFQLAALEDATYRYILTPAYGSIRFNGDGTGCYRAMAGYRGQDAACIELYDEAGNRHAVNLEITVTE